VRGGVIDCVGVHVTDLEINIAIAEACGKPVCRHGPILWEHRGTDADSELYCTICGKALSDLRAPNYCTDRDAIHEALSILTDDEWKVFMDLLCVVVTGDKRVLWFYKQSDVVISMFKATARQWAEAFLRTVGKWKY